MKSYEEMEKEIKSIREQVIKSTNESFKEEIDRLENQEKLLSTFLFNNVEWEMSETDDTQFFFLSTLFSESIQSSRTIRELIICGKYSSAGSLLRNLFECILVMGYLGKKPENWKIWMEYQQLTEEEGKKPLEKRSPRLRQLIKMFSPSTLMEGYIVNEDIKENYKWTYGYLCLFSHTSMERIRRVIGKTDQKKFMLKYAHTFNSPLSKHLLDTLFAFLDTIYDVFKEFANPKEKGCLLEYTKIRPNS